MEHLPRLISLSAHLHPESSCCFSSPPASFTRVNSSSAPYKRSPSDSRLYGYTLLCRGIDGINGALTGSVRCPLPLPPGAIISMVNHGPAKRIEIHRKRGRCRQRQSSGKCTARAISPPYGKIQRSARMSTAKRSIAIVNATMYQYSGRTLAIGNLTTCIEITVSRDPEKRSSVGIR